MVSSRWFNRFGLSFVRDTSGSFPMKALPRPCKTTLLSVLVLLGSLVAGCARWTPAEEPAPQLLSRSDPPSRLRVVTDSARYVLKDLRVTADSLFGTTTTTGYEPPPGKPVGLALADVRSLEVEKSDAGSAVIVVLVLVTGAVVGLSLGLRGLMGN
jgi:hypothetical protein